MAAWDCGVMGDADTDKLLSDTPFALLTGMPLGHRIR